MDGFMDRWLSGWMDRKVVGLIKLMDVCPNG